MEQYIGLLMSHLQKYNPSPYQILTHFDIPNMCCKSSQII